jgi:DNA repair exonuclease SbcCD ATPase subunit
VRVRKYAGKLSLSMNNNDDSTTTLELLTVAGLDAAAVSATVGARRLRDDLLARAVAVPDITDTASANAAAAVLVNLKNFSREIEASRKDVKAPVIDIGKQIDALASDLTARVEAEAARLGKLLGAWQAMQNALQKEQQRKAWLAEQEIKRKAAEAERIAAEELAKKQRELEAKAARARTTEGAERAALELAQAERKAAEAQQRRIDEQAAALVAAQAAVTTVAAKPEGVSTRTEVCYEVTDVVALYEAAPYLVRLDVNTAALKQALKTLRADQHLPGVRHWTETRSIVR